LCGTIDADQSDAQAGVRQVLKPQRAKFEQALDWLIAQLPRKQKLTATAATVIDSAVLYGQRLTVVAKGIKIGASVIWSFDDVTVGTPGDQRKDAYQQR
jgi:hypothetical protein